MNQSMVHGRRAAPHWLGPYRHCVLRLGDPVTEAHMHTHPALLAGLRLFQGVDRQLALNVLDETERRDLGAGEVLLTPGQPNESVYVLLSGSLDIHLGSLEDTPLTRIEPGGCVGEMSIIERRDPSAWVRATEPCHLLVIDQDHLWQLIDRSHAFARNLLTLLSERVRWDNRVIIDSSGTLKDYERVAITDALTGVHNRRWLDEMYRRHLRRCNQGGLAACLVMIDIDHFAEFNETWSHLSGDLALKMVADTLRDSLRPTDMVARSGGDEFLVLLPETELEDCVAVAERMLAKVRDTHCPGAEDHVTVSAGVAIMRDQDTLDSMVERAHGALKRAKRAGKNRVTL